MRSGGLFGKENEEQYVNIPVWSLRKANPFNNFGGLLPEKNFFIELPAEGTVLSQEDHFNHTRKAARLAQMKATVGSYQAELRDQAANNEIKGYAYFLKIKKSVYDRIRKEIEKKKLAKNSKSSDETIQTYHIQLEREDYQLIGVLNCTTNGYGKDVENKQILSNAECEQAEIKYFSRMAAKSVAEDDKYKNYIFTYLSINNKGIVQQLNTMIKLKDGTQLPVVVDDKGNTSYKVTGETVLSDGVSEITTTLYKQQYSALHDANTRGGGLLPSGPGAYDALHNPWTIGGGLPPSGPGAYDALHNPWTIGGGLPPSGPGAYDALRNPYTQNGPTAEELYEQGIQEEEKKNFNQAACFYEQASVLGYIRAKTNLANLHLKNLLGSLSNKKTAYDLLMVAAVAGHARAQYNLGMMLEHGDGVPKNLVQAKDWYAKAASQKDTKAEKCLERVNKKLMSQHAGPDAYEALRNPYTQDGPTAEELYEQGIQEEGKKNFNQAAYFYEQASKLGYMRAKTNLANLHLKNLLGGLSNKKTAYDLLMVAAVGGHARAQISLGMMFEYGDGAPKNLVQAKAWYAKAASQKDTKAEKCLEHINIKIRNVFEAIYEALRDGQSGFIKSNFVAENKHLSADKFIRAVKRHAEDLDSRTAKAWELTQKYNDFNPKNVELCSEIHAWSLEKSGLFKRSRAKSNLGASSLFGQDQQKEGSRTQKIVAALNRRYKP